jgi:hypothetical protein
VFSWPNQSFRSRGANSYLDNKQTEYETSLQNQLTMANPNMEIIPYLWGIVKLGLIQERYIFQCSLWLHSRLTKNLPYEISGVLTENVLDAVKLKKIDG